jgi:hypothetical protein
MRHVVGPRHGGHEQLSARCLLAHLRGQLGGDLVGQRRSSGQTHVELNRAQPAVDDGVERLGQAAADEGLGEDPELRHCAAGSVSSTVSPVVSDRSIAASTRAAAKPSVAPAPACGTP